MKTRPRGRKTEIPQDCAGYKNILYLRGCFSVEKKVFLSYTSLTSIKKDKRMCVFCQIIDKELPAHIVYENAHTLCIIPNKIKVYGHVLVLPKKHYQNLFDIPTEQLNLTMATAQTIALHMKNKLKATGVNLLHATGQEAGQSVDHFHIHLLPRFADDRVDAWPKFEKKEFPIVEIFNKLTLMN